MPTPLGEFGGALSTAFAADLSSIAVDSGVLCQIGTVQFYAVPEYIGKDVALAIGIAGMRGTIIKLHATTSQLPPPPLRAQTPITVGITPAVPAGVAMLVKEAFLEADGTLTVIFCELAP
jgi:hypothetical protein